MVAMNFPDWVGFEYQDDENGSCMLHYTAYTVFMNKGLGWQPIGLTRPPSRTIYSAFLIEMRMNDEEGLTTTDYKSWFTDYMKLDKLDRIVRKNQIYRRRDLMADMLVNNGGL